MPGLKPVLAALVLFAIPAIPAGAQSPEIGAAQVDRVLAACTAPRSDACIAALDSVIAAFPGMQPAVVVGALAAQLAALSNAAIAAGTAVDAAALASALTALAAYASTALGLTGLGTTIAAIAAAVAAGEEVDIGAIASGEGEGAPDGAVSPA